MYHIVWNIKNIKKEKVFSDLVVSNHSCHHNGDHDLALLVSYLTSFFFKLNFIFLWHNHPYGGLAQFLWSSSSFSPGRLLHYESWNVDRIVKVAGGVGFLQN